MQVPNVQADAVVSVKPEVKIEPVVQQVAALQPAEKAQSNWDIKSTSDGFITATNIVTNRLYEGSIADFNAWLRG